MSLTCQNCLTMPRERKKNWLTKSPRNSTSSAPPHRAPFHVTTFTTVTLNDWLTVCLSSCQTKNPTAMCRPTLNFFLSLPHQFLHFSLLVYLKISCQFIVCVCFFSLPFFDMLNENEIITSHIFYFTYDWWGIQMSLNLILFHTETKCKHNHIA